MNFWYDTNGKFVILWQGDKQAYSNHKPKNLSIAGNAINQIYEYESFIIKDTSGNILKEYNYQKEYHYFAAYLDYSEDFVSQFNIVLDAGSGGFNVDVNAKINFYILVQHNVGGKVNTDWKQSKSNIEVGEKYRVNCNKYTRVEYKYVNITYPDNTTETKTQDSIDIIGTEGVTKVLFNYDTSTTRDVVVNKIWDDNDNYENTRPKKIRIYLTINEQETSTYYDLDSVKESSHTFSGIQKYDTNDNIINYGIKEKEINQGELKQYKSSISGDMINGFVIENMLLKDYVDTIDIRITAPDRITSKDENIEYNINFSFSISEEYTENVIDFSIKDILPYNIDLTKENNFDGGKYNPAENTITWNGSYNKSNKTITWDNGKTEIIDSSAISVQKVISVVYKDLISQNNTSIVNKVIGTTRLIDAISKEVEDSAKTLIDFYVDIIINKLWKNDVSYDENGNEIISEIRPSKISFKLLDNNNFIQDIQITKDDNWTTTLSNLPKYSEITGEEITYNIVEIDTLERYTNKIERTINKDEITFDVTNEKINKTITVPITGGKGVRVFYVFGVLIMFISIAIYKYKN